MNDRLQPKPRSLSLRRLGLLATTIAGVSALAFFASPGFAPVSPPALAQNLSQEAQSVARPVGFADIVEKVKPAVVSVRVKTVSANQLSSDDIPGGSQLEQFFRRFGMPEGMPG